MHALLHFFKHLLGAGVVPTQPETPGDFLDNPPVGLCLPRRRQCGTAHLHLAVGVGDGAGLFRPGGGRQDNVGKLGGLGDEQVLYHQVFQGSERGPGVGQVRVGHRWVFAKDVHALDGARLDGVHNLHHGQPRLRVQFGAPEFFESGSQLGIPDRLVIRQYHWDQAGIGGALHIVLPPQRVQAGSGPAGVAACERQGNQASGVVGAVHVLGDAHAPENHRFISLGVGSGHFTNGVGLNAADRAHHLRGHAFNARCQCLEAFGVGVNVGLVKESFADNHIEHGVEE